MKLFKKALAAVLAGVMALSMAACTPNTPVDPDKPVDPTLTDAEKFVQIVNDQLDKLVAIKNLQEDYVVTAEAMENKLGDKAAAILDKLAEGVTTASGKITGYNISDEDYNKLTEGVTGVFVLNNGTSATVLSQTNFEVDLASDENALDAFAFDEKTAKAYVATNMPKLNSAWLEKTVNVAGVQGSADIVSVEYTWNVQFGIASKVINGKTCTVLVWA